MDRRDFSKVMGTVVAAMVAGSQLSASEKSAYAKKAAELHVCKGFNACKGKGGCSSGDAGCAGKNSCKGKGGCASKAAKHDCAGKNACKGQGGCGYLSANPDKSLLPASEQFTPGRNPGAGNGGCLRRRHLIRQGGQAGTDVDFGGRIGIRPRAVINVDRRILFAAKGGRRVVLRNFAHRHPDVRA